MKVLTVTDNFPDGQKIVSARIIYDQEVPDCAAVDFEVRDRRITDVANEGNSVTLHLDPKDEKAPLIIRKKHPPLKPGEKPPLKPPHNMKPTQRQPVELEVRQVNRIGCVEPWGFVKTDGSIEPVVSDFTQHSFENLKYNLFAPEIKAGELYPLVVFLHDAHPCGDDPKLTLSQGNGAVTWAKAEWQREHPCYVLAPQLPRGMRLVNDDFESTEDVDTIIRLIKSVISENAVDENRVYATGQSIGCMTVCEMNVREPELFAASLLVAGQWNPETMAEKCAGSYMWIIVSGGDEKALPGMTAVVDAMESKGAKVGRYIWNGRWSAGQFDAAVSEALAQDANIRFSVYEGNSIIPEGAEANPGLSHINTWPVTYEINGLKEWLFSNSKRG